MPLMTTKQTTRKDKVGIYTKRLGFCCLGIGAVCCHQVQAQDATNSLAISALYIDNIGLANLKEDQISDAVIEIEGHRTYRKPLGLSEAFFYGANINIRDYYDYPCDRIRFGAQLGYEKKLGLGFDKPRLSIAWSGSRNIYRVDSLNGYSTEVSARLSKPVNERVDVAIALAKNWENPDNSPNTFGLPESAQGIASDALNQRTLNLTASAEYYVNQYWSIPVTLSYLDGDLASIARGRQSNLVYADAVANDEGLGPDWFVYRSAGHAWSANFAASRVLKDGSLLNVEFEYNEANVRGNMKYDRHRIAISWLKNW